MPRTITPLDASGKYDVLVGRIRKDDRVTLVKMHGCVSAPDTIVVTRDDYETYAQHHPAIVTYLQSLLATRTFLFVGFSLTDPNFRGPSHNHP